MAPCPHVWLRCQGQGSLPGASPINLWAADKKQTPTSPEESGEILEAGERGESYPASLESKEVLEATETGKFEKINSISYKTQSAAATALTYIT